MTQRLKILVFVLACLFFTKAMLANTWYVRVDGGSRYSVDMPTGQCDGLGDAAYPGIGVDRHCAFADWRYVYDDQSYGNTNAPAGNWAIAGGDTVILDNTNQWRVGFDGDGSATDAWCYGGHGAYACSNPTIPSGTALHHTRILGRNYASCNTAGTSNRSAMTQIFGGHGVFSALNLQGAQYVDVECIEITRHSQCMVHGSPAYPSYCNTGVPIDDYDSDGISFDSNAHDVFLQDLWIHGHTDRGILGPIGGLITANRVNISYNGNAGWDFDTNTGTNDLSVQASLKLSYTTIEWNGCNQEYPIVDTYPAISCYSQSTGGYGDGMGTPPGMGMNVSIDHSIFRYNTQDGEDFGHIDTGSSTLSITDSISYANNGGQFKWGPGFSSTVFENNLVLGNCLRMSQPIAGAPSTFNTYLSDFCRAGSTISFNFEQGATALVANNTFVNYAPVTFDFQCVGFSCSTSSMTLTNNIFLGYDNPATYSFGGQPGGPGLYCGPACNGSAEILGTINRSNNSYYGIRGACEAGVATESLAGAIASETCDDPFFLSEPEPFTSEAALDNYNFALSSGSPNIAAGIAVRGLTTDYNGVTFLSPSSIGAIQYVSGASVPIVPFLSFALIANQTYGAAPFAVSATSASSSVVSYTVASGPASISGNTVSITGIGTVVLSAAQPAIGNYAAAAATISFPVAAETPSLSFVAIPDQTFGNPSLTIGANSASTGTVTYAVNSGPALISGTVVTLTGAGTVTLTASQMASGNYAAASAMISFAVAPAMPSLSFAAIMNQTFGGVPIALFVNSASSGTVTYEVRSGPATISGSIVTFTGAGQVMLSASQVASGNYSAATATTNFQILPGTPTLSFAAVANQTFGNSPLTISATSISNGAVVYSVSSGPATMAGGTLTITGAGVIVLSASQAATTNYAGATSTTSFTVAPEAPTLTFAGITSKTFGNPAFSVNATSASNGAVAYTVSGGPATISGNTLLLTGAGTVTLNASQAASGNYSAATATTSIMVAPKVPALSFAAIGGQTFGNAPLSLSATSASNGVVTYTVSDGPATISGNTLTMIGAGTVVLSASQANSGNYAAATATMSFTIAPETPSLSFTTITSQIIGASPLITVIAISPSSGAVTYSVSSGPATVSGSTVTLNGGGVVVLSATQAASGNYAAATTTLSFTVALQTPTLSFAAITNQRFGNSPVPLKANSISNGAVTYTVLSGPAVVSGNMLTLTGAGVVTLSASQAAVGDYAAATATAGFTVSPAVPVLSFAAIADQVFGNSPLTVSAISASSGAVTYSVLNGPGTITGNILALTGGGTVVLSASQVASGNYAAATAVASIRVGPEVTMLSFAPVANLTYGAAPFAVSAASASTGALSYAVVSGPATIFVNTLTLTGAGTVVVSAAQQATPDYTASATTLTFAVSTPVFTITSAGLATSAGSLTTQPGGAATFSLLALPGMSGRFPDLVTFTASGLPPGAVATFLPSAITPGSGTTAVTFTIQTSSQVARNNVPLPVKPFAPLAFAMLLPVLCGRQIRRQLLQNSRLLTAFVFAVLSLSTMASLSACGAGGASSQPVIAAHTYAVSVIATDHSTGSQSTTNVSLVVQ